MAFNKAQLQSDFEAVFESMTDGDEDTFPDGISDAVVTFVSGGKVSTQDAGTVVPPGTPGAFTGSGTGSLSVTATACAKIIKDACTAMKTMTSGGDDYLAEEMGRGFKKMADDGTVSTTVTGTLQPPSSAPPITPYSGPATGKITCSEATLVAKLKLLFKKMYNQREEEGFDGNKEFAKELANEINSFYTSGSVSTNGSGNVTGVTGSGSIA